MNYDLLLSFILATSALAISPGPDNIYVLMQSLVNGKKYGIATVCGLITGCLVHTTLVAFGVSAIIKQNDSLFFIIKLFGALYLLYLAFNVYKSDAELSLNSNNIPKKSTTQLFKQGFIMNVLNPKVSIFFLAFFPGFLFSNTLSTITQFYVLGFIFMIVSFIMNVLNPKVSIFFLAFFPGFLFSTTLNTITQFYVLGFIFMIVSFIIFSIIAVLSGLISEYIKKHKNVGFILKWLQIIVFVGIAIFILLSEK